MTDKQTEALTLALYALEPRAGMPEPEYESLANCAITAIKEALAQPEQEPCKTCGGAGEVETGIGMMICDECHGTTYTTPPQRKPLTDEQIHKASTQAGMQEHYMGFHSGFIRFARAIEAAHGIKGEA